MFIVGMKQIGLQVSQNQGFPEIVKNDLPVNISDIVLNKTHQTEGLKPVSRGLLINQRIYLGQV